MRSEVCQFSVLLDTNVMCKRRIGPVKSDRITEYLAKTKLHKKESKNVVTRWNWSLRFLADRKALLTKSQGALGALSTRSQ